MQRLAAAGERKNRKGKKQGNGLPLTGGSNVGGPSDEVIARHLKDIRAAIAKREKAKSAARDAGKVVTNYIKIAAGDGMDRKALLKMLADEDRPTGEVVAERRAIARYEKVSGSPLGTQWSLLDGDQPLDIDAYATGEHAGMNGERADTNPHTPGTESFQRYASGWAAGQARLAKEKFANGEPPATEPDPFPDSRPPAA